MAREARVILEVADPNNSSTILHALKRHHDRFDVERGEGDVQCYVDFPGDPDAVALDAVHFLNEKGLAHLIALPPRIEWWDESAYHYVDPAQPLVDVAPLTDVRWRITVWPTDFFDWRRARAELDRRQRPPLRETRRKLEIPAEDEADALRLAGMLQEISGLGPMKIERLGWFRRWLARERLFGGYATGG